MKKFFIQYNVTTSYETPIFEAKNEKVALKQLEQIVGPVEVERIVEVEPHVYQTMKTTREIDNA